MSPRCGDAARLDDGTVRASLARGFRPRFRTVNQPGDDHRRQVMVKWRQAPPQGRRKSARIRRAVEQHGVAARGEQQGGLGIADARQGQLQAAVGQAKGRAQQAAAQQGISKPSGVAIKAEPLVSSRASNMSTVQSATRQENQ